MNPRSSTKKDVQLTAKQTPFEEISTVEEREESRMQQTLAKIEQEHSDGEKAIRQSEENAENKLREAALEEIRAFASTEPAAILQRYHAETEKEIAHIEENFKKHGVKTAKKLVDSILNFSFLSKN